MTKGNEDKVISMMEESIKVLGSGLDGIAFAIVVGFIIQAIFNR